MQVGIKITALCAVMMIPGTASAGQYALKVMPTAVQKSRFDHGIASIDSTQRSTVVRVVNVGQTDKNSVTFVIGVANIAGEPFNFGPENITVRPSGAQPIALTTYEEASEAERKKQGREKFWSGLAAFGRGMSAANAGTTYTNGSYSGTTNGFVGGNFVTAQSNGSYSGTQYNSGAALAAQRNARELNAQDRANLEAKWAARSSVNNNLLRTTTVDPGAMYGGIATFPLTPEIKKAHGPIEVRIEVNAGGDKHVFVGQIADVG